MNIPAKRIFLPQFVLLNLILRMLGATQHRACFYGIYHLLLTPLVHGLVASIESFVFSLNQYLLCACRISNTMLGKQNALATPSP